MAVWPVTLPQYPTGPVMTELVDSRIRSQPDTGPPLMRRRYTSAIRNVEAPMILTGAELAIFDAFYETDLLHGTLRFQWIDFRTDELVQYRFVEPPKWTTLHGDASPGNRRWQATFKLEILPGLFAGVVRNIAATLVGEAVLTARAGRLLSVSASLLGSSSLTAAPGEFLSEYAAATLIGNSILTADPRATRGIAATLTGQATLIAGAELVPGGTVNAVELDGVGQHYAMAALGTLAPAPGAGHTIHFWRKKALDGVEQALYWRGDITTATPAPEVSIVVRADNKVHAAWYDAAGNLIGQVTSAGTFTVADGKVPIGLDISGDSATLRLKGIDDGVNAPPTAAGGYIEFGGTRYLGRSGDAGDLRQFEGCLAEDWEAPVSLGFDDDDIYEKFVDTTLTAGLAPRDLGANGEGPSDQVFGYFNGGYATYHQNQAAATDSPDYVPVGFIQPCADSFGVYSAALAIAEVTNTHNALNGDNAAGSTYNSVALGDPHPSRVIRIGVTAHANLGVPGGDPTVTIDGVSMGSAVVSIMGSNGNERSRAHIFCLPQASLSDPNATTATVVVTYPGGQHRGKSIHVYRTIGISATASDTGSSTNSDPLTDTITFPDVGFVLAIGKNANDNVGAAWTNVSEDYDNATFGRVSAAHAFPSVAGSTAVSVAFTNPGVNTAMVCAAFPLA